MSPNLSDIARQLLDPQLPMPAYAKALAHYEALLQAQHLVDSSRTHTEHGMGLNSAEAATCLQDERRTRAFLLATDAAIRHQRTQTRAPVHLLYAGTGPWATLALPLLATYPAAQLKVTGLEVNAASAGHLQGLLRLLGLADHMEVVHTDATAYQVTNPVHVLLSETMQAGLRDEPQVAIFQHLIPQLAPGASLIPQEICLSLALLPEQLRPEAKWLPLDTVFRLAKAGDLPGTEHRCRLPQNREGFAWLGLLTHIQLDDTYTLEAFESGLTHPLILAPLATLPAQSPTVRTHYSIEQNPGLVYHISHED